MLAACTLLLLLLPASALATSPASELEGADRVRAERMLAKARDRGVGELPGTGAYQKVTACGRADSALVRARRTFNEIRRAQRALARGGPGAQRRLAATRRKLAKAAKQVRTQSKRKQRACVRRGTVRQVLEDLGALVGVTKAEGTTRRVAGTGRVLALPVDFPGRPADRAASTPDRFEQLFFGGSYPHGGGSLDAYFREMSYGAFRITGDVRPWQRMPRPYADYGRDAGMGRYPGNSQRLLEDAVDAADAGVDFGRFDNDGPDNVPNSGDDDGYADAVFLVFAGSTMADGDGAGMWPHAWQHEVATRDRAAGGGTIRVRRYAALPERVDGGPDGGLLTVGVAAHEYGHILGLPDLHGANDDGTRGVGDWDLMGTGMWGVQGSARPSGLSAWSRARLGWLRTEVLAGDHPNHALASIAERGVAAKLPMTGQPLHEHVLVERRTRTGFDADLPADGLLVWKVDDSRAGNDDLDRPRLTLVPADGQLDGNAGDLLREGGALNDSTTPSLRAGGTDSDVAVQNVVDGGARADLHAGKQSLAPAIDAATETGGPQAAAPTTAWGTPVNGSYVRATVPLSCTGTGSPNVNRIEFRRGGTSIGTVTGTAAPTLTLTTNWNTTTLANGAYSMQCRARNTSNQWSALSTAITLNVDNTLPGTPSITTPAAGAWVRGTVPWTVTGTDNTGVSQFNFSVDSGTNWQTFAPASPSTQIYNWDTTTVADGPRSLSVRSQDRAGGQSTPSAARVVNVDNTPPTAGTVRDGSAADITVQTSTTTLQANWTGFSDPAPASGMNGYQYCISSVTNCAGTQVTAGWVSTAATTASVGSLTLANGSTWYTCVRALDVVGNVRTVCSNGVTVDSGANPPATVGDGASAPDQAFTATTNAASGWWVAATDPSGVADYSYCISTATNCGGTVLRTWTTTAGLTGSATGLSLAHGTTVYTCVRTRDTLGNVSAPGCSNGIVVDIQADPPSAVRDGAGPADEQATGSSTALDLNWNAADETGESGVASYEYCISSLTGCAGIVATAPTWTANGAALAATHAMPLADGETWFACVRTVDALGTVSAPACSNGIVVDQSASPPAIVNDGAGPGDADWSSSATSYGVLWSAVSDPAGVDRYEYCLATATACGGSVLTAGWESAGTGTSVTKTGLALTAGQVVFACVRTVDLAGNTSTETCSDGATIDLAAPTGSITAPTAGATLVGTNSVTVSGSDDVGAVQVAWFAGATPIGTQSFAATTTVNRTLSWDTTSVADGTYTLTAVITDASGKTTTTAGVSVTVDNPPAIQITAPAPAAKVGGTAVSVAATANDADGVTRVEFRVDGVLLGTHGPSAAVTPRNATWTWNTTSPLIANGSHTLEARSYDSLGNTATDTITVVVDNAAPGTPAMSGIAPGATVSGVRPVTASGVDNQGIVQARYVLDGGTARTSTFAAASPFSDTWNWNTTSVPDGNHTLYVESRDEAGNAADNGASFVQFVVNNTVEGVLPGGTITAPAGGATLTGFTSLTVNATDNNAVVKVEWLLTGAGCGPCLISTDGGVPAGHQSGLRTKSWGSTSRADGAYTLAARITDASGNQGTTAPVSVTIDNTP